MAIFSSNGTANGYGVQPRPGSAYEPDSRAKSMLGWIRDRIGGWLGPDLSRGTDREKIVREEKARSGPAGIVLPWFLPWHEDVTGETSTMRRMYRLMLNDPHIKSAIFGKVFGIASKKLKFQPDGAGPLAKNVARFVDNNFNRRLKGKTRKLVEVTAVPMCIDGYCVAEKVFKPESKGEWSEKWILRDLKSKDAGPGNDLALLTDEFRNVTGLLGIRYNGGKVFSPANFVIQAFMPLFESATGMSDLRAAYGCYDDQTEILTKDGWKLFADLTDADEVATLDHSEGSGRLVYEKPSERNSYPFKGQMFRQDSHHVDLLVTPNHRMWVAKRGQKEKEFRFVEAQDLMDGSFPKIYLYKRDAEWEGQEKPAFKLPAVTHPFGGLGRERMMKTVPAKELPMDDWLRFLGIWLAEGSTHRRKMGNRQCSVTITQNPGEIFQEIEAVVKRLGFNYCITAPTENHSACTLKISNLQLWTYLSRIGKSHAKHIPEEFKTLSRRQLNILLEWMMKGDGRHGNTEYATVSDRLADDVSSLILKCGFAPLTRREKTKTGGIWVVSANRKGISGTEVNRLNESRSWEEYDGLVYCVTTKNGIVYVRRNGKSCWCGNSYWMLDTTKKLRMIGLDKRSVPILLGEYATQQQKPGLEAALQQARSSSWFSVPAGVKVTALEIAGRSQDEYESAVRDFKHDIYIGITFAVLQALEGNVTGARSIGEVHQDTSKLPGWYLSTLIQDILNEEEGGLVPDVVDMNFAGAGYPLGEFESIDLEELQAESKIDDALHNRGMDLSKKEQYERYGRKPPIILGNGLADPQDVLKGAPPKPQTGTTPGGSTPHTETMVEFGGPGSGPHPGGGTIEDKEPHEMTQREYIIDRTEPKHKAAVTRGTRELEDLKGKLGTARSELKRHELRTATGPGRTEDEIQKDVAASTAKVKGLEDRIKRAGTALARTDTLKYMHKVAVEKAAAAGKHIPPEVLADYPHLAKTAEHAEAEGASATPFRFSESWTGYVESGRVG